MERFGLVGFPNSGKSSLFNALTGSSALAAPFPFATKEAHVGMAAVPDKRLGLLAEMSGSAKRTPAQVQFCDIGGIVEGASQGEGLGNQLLSHIREVEAIVYVLQAFETEDLPQEHDPLSQLHILELELSLADFESTQRQLERREKQARSDPSMREEVSLLEKAARVLAEGTPIYRSELSDEEKAALAANFLLTNKPIMVLANLGEEILDAEASQGSNSQGDDPQASNPQEEVSPDGHGSPSNHLQGSEIASVLAEDLPQAEVTGMCVRLEEEVAQLPPEEQAEMLQELGLGEGALAAFARAARKLLSLHTFFTTGEKESRAWTFKAGSTARECAGAIHTDFEKGFIRAETIACEDLLAIGSWTAAKQAGKIRAEGRDYQTQDGDVMEFRFTPPR